MKSPRRLPFSALAVVLVAWTSQKGFQADAEVLTAPLIPRGAVWRFLANGSNQGTNWVGLEFNDATWVSGTARLGYGGDGEVTTVSFGPNPGAKYITTYFRRTFEVADRSVFRALKLRVVRDDGAVVYLNAVEVFRSNMPAGSIGFTTNASSALSGGDEFIASETNLSPALLRNGLNVLAVEVHQSGGASSDLGFDLALDGEYAGGRSPSLELRAMRAPNQVVVTWPQLSVGHVLQSSPRLPQTNQWRTVTNPVAVSGTNNRVAVAVADDQFFRLRSAPVDASTLSNKLLFGYQAWFACTNDSAPPNRWVHWFRNQTPVATNATVDFWPDISELEGDELFATGMTLPNGTPAKVYAAYKHKTVLRHFRWMHDYGVDGVFLQRFTSELGDRSFADWRNQIAYSCRAGAETYGRVFALMYDISGQNSNTLVATLTNDWNYISGTMRLTNSARYLRHNGKPIVAIWGLGFTDRPGTAADAQTLITWFKAAGCTVMGGVPTNWRTLGGDSKTDPAWTPLYRSFDIISPWSVGRYSSSTGADNFRQNYIVPDLAEARLNGRDYLPVIWPGFSWRNLNNGPLNQIPRNGGRFWWRQLYNARFAGCHMIYGAMFDEVDEGTAMFKLAPTDAQLPAQGSFVPLNIDGEALPSDWYLRLAGEGSKMLRGEIPLTSMRPINP
ncbi:MAG TPA: glycoside hydrolase family 71/99-like protein [Verrucomicrobiae bacterium]|nr:glycoside hydrolase family 71/99-like protein [Verrucomicrobiae bacterium]